MTKRISDLSDIDKRFFLWINVRESIGIYGICFASLLFGTFLIVAAGISGLPDPWSITTLLAGLGECLFGVVIAIYRYKYDKRVISEAKV